MKLIKKNNKSYKQTQRDLKQKMNMFDRLPVKYCVFSYSDEGLISLDEMKQMGSRYKSYEIFEKQHKRHVMSGIGAGAKELTTEQTKNIEYVILIEK